MTWPEAFHVHPATLVPAVSGMIPVAFEHRSFVEARDSDVAVRVQFDVQGFVGLLQELIKGCTKISDRRVLPGAD